ncbi:MAG: FAD-dependent oxidoreductase, partial [Mesorhizobium sp.]
MSLDILDIGGAPVIIGAGLAGLVTALYLAPEPVVLLSSAPLGTEACSALAQGGLAASLGCDDGPDLHLADTLAAGGGQCTDQLAPYSVAGGMHDPPSRMRRLERQLQCAVRAAVEGDAEALEV